MVINIYESIPLNTRTTNGVIASASCLITFYSITVSITGIEDILNIAFSWLSIVFFIVSFFTYFIGMIYKWKNYLFPLATGILISFIVSSVIIMGIAAGI